MSKDNANAASTVTLPQSPNLQYVRVVSTNANELLGRVWASDQDTRYDLSFHGVCYSTGLTPDKIVKSIENNVTRWGVNRGDHPDQLLACHFVETNAQAVVGYVNIGISANFEGAPLEFGSLFTDKTSVEQQAEALKAVVIDYATENKHLLKGNHATSKFVLTTFGKPEHVAEHNTKEFIVRNDISDAEAIASVKSAVAQTQADRIKAAEEAGLTKLTVPPALSSNDAELFSILTGMLGNRFHDGGDHLIEEGRPVEVFYHQFDAVDLAGSVDGVSATVEVA